MFFCCIIICIMLLNNKRKDMSSVFKIIGGNQGLISYIENFSNKSEKDQNPINIFVNKKDLNIKDLLSPPAWKKHEAMLQEAGVALQQESYMCGAAEATEAVEALNPTDKKPRLLFGDSYAHVDHFREGDIREKAVIFVSGRDHNSCIFSGNHNYTMRSMAKRYNLMIQFTDSPAETFERFLKITSDVNDIAHISFFAHGNRNAMSFADDGDFSVGERENPLLRRVLSKLKEDGTVALFSCSTGVEGGVADFMARHLSRRAAIYAPTDRIYFLKLVDEDRMSTSFRMLGLELGSERHSWGDRLRDITRVIRVTDEEILDRCELKGLIASFRKQKPVGVRRLEEKPTGINSMITKKY